MHRSLGIAEHCLAARGPWAAKRYSTELRNFQNTWENRHQCRCDAQTPSRRLQCIHTRSYSQTRAQHIRGAKEPQPRSRVGRQNSTGSVVREDAYHDPTKAGGRREFEKEVSKQRANLNQHRTSSNAGPNHQQQSALTWACEVRPFNKARDRAKSLKPFNDFEGNLEKNVSDKREVLVKGKAGLSSSKPDGHTKLPEQGSGDDRFAITTSAPRKTGFEDIYEADESLILHNLIPSIERADTYNREIRQDKLGNLLQGRKKTPKRNEEAEHKARTKLGMFAESCDIQDPESWNSLVQSITRLYSHNGAWAIFQFMRDRKLDAIFADPDSDYLRNSIIDAAVIDGGRLRLLIQAAEEHSSHLGFKWPHLPLYALQSQLNNHLDMGDAEYQWIIPLCTPLSSSDMAQLIAQFPTDAFDSRQEVLMDVYTRCSEKTLYDKIIPFLFKTGNSRQAMAWRKLLVSSGDVPKSNDSADFLRFLIKYYPTVKLSVEESKILQSKSFIFGIKDALADSRSSTADDHHRSGQFSDKMVARWFASSWTPIEFAINFVQRLGLKVIGPQSLQALALRDPDCNAVAGRIKHLAKLGIEIESQPYCRSIVQFADNGNEWALTTLLNSDIHPDEFESGNTRMRLRQAATDAGDWTTAKLMEQIEVMAKTLEHKSPVMSFSATGKEARISTPRVQHLLEQMQRSALEPTQFEAMNILYYLFERLPIQGARSHSERNYLFRAVNVTVSMASKSLAIPTRCWQMLLISLLRAQEWKRLEQLCSILPSLYMPHHGPMMPIHVQDVPGAPKLSKSSLNGVFNGLDQQPTSGRPQPIHAMPPGLVRSDRSSFPSDLAFSHRQHPLSMIFNIKMQRAIIRLGFQTTQTPPSFFQTGNSLSIPQEHTFDIARGVALLAILRDWGLSIDEQVIVSATIYEHCLSVMPGATRHRNRDNREMTSRVLKTKVEAAWGEPVLPTVEEIDEIVIKKTPPALARHNRQVVKAMKSGSSKRRRWNGGVSHSKQDHDTDTKAKEAEI